MRTDPVIVHLMTLPLRCHQFSGGGGSPEVLTTQNGNDDGECKRTKLLHRFYDITNNIYGKISSELKKNLQRLQAVNGIKVVKENIQMSSILYHRSIHFAKMPLYTGVPARATDAKSLLIPAARWYLRWKTLPLVLLTPVPLRVPCAACVCCW